jgi:ABC-type transporter Mla subunit MlaD
MGYDYTTKMQELARDREAARSWEGQRQQYDSAIQEIRTFLQDKARVEQYLREAFDRQSADGEQAPLTQADVQRMLAQQRQELIGMTQQQMAQVQAQQQIDGLAQNYSQQFDSHIRQLADTMPELKSIPRLSKLLKEEVGEMAPRNPEEAKAMMTELARQWQGQIKSQQLESRKQQGTMPNPALARGIEPPGGQGPMPPAQPNYKGKITDQAFKDLVMSDIVKTMNAGG